MAEEIHSQAKLDLKVLYDRYGLKLAVTRDWVQAYLAYVPQVPGESQPQDNLNVLSQEFVREVLAERKIVFGLQEKAIASFLADPPHDTKVLIAQGIPAVPGEDAKIELVYDKRDGGPSPQA